MTIRSRRGMSVIEVLIVLVISTVLMSVLYSLFSLANKSFSRTGQRLDPREAASRALMRARNYLVDSSRYLILGGGNGVMFEAADEAGAIEFDAAQATLTFRSIMQAGAAPVVLASGVKSFTVHQLHRGVLRLSLTLDRPDVSDGLAALAPLSLVDEIHLVAASRQRKIPYNRGWGMEGPGGPGGFGPAGPGGFGPGPGGTGEDSPGDFGPGPGGPGGEGGMGGGPMELAGAGAGPEMDGGAAPGMMD